MTVSDAIGRLTRLHRGIAEQRPRTDEGPIRLECSPSSLARSLESEGEKHLAHVLWLRLRLPPGTISQLFCHPVLSSWMKAPQRFLEIVGRGAVPELSFSRAERRALALYIWSVSSASEVSSVLKLPRHPRTSLRLEVPWSAASGNSLIQAFRDLPEWEGPVSGTFHPRTEDDERSLRDSWGTLLESARNAGMAIDCHLEGLESHPGAPVSHSNEAAVLGEMVRGIFRQRPSLCSYPFIMLDLQKDGTAKLCPKPDGPWVSFPDGHSVIQAFADQQAVDLRGRFLAGESPSGSCEACTLYATTVGELCSFPAAPARTGFHV